MSTATTGRQERLPGGHLAPWRRALRYHLYRALVGLTARAYLRVRLEGRACLPAGPSILCFNHLGWIDPFMLMAALPLRPRLYFFGPREADMRAGLRNRLITWTASAVPYRPGRQDLLAATRRVEAVLATGAMLAIAGEGRISVGESRMTQLSDGPAYFALRTGVPLVPVAIGGTSWVALGRRVTVRVGEPLLPAGRATAESVADLTGRLQASMEAMIAEAPDPTVPGPFGRWLTDLFNDWPEGDRPAV